MITYSDKFSIPAVLAPGCAIDSFPPPHAALREPNGLIAIGADLNPERLLYAYRRSIFPWYSANQPILWWSPQPRFVIFSKDIKVSRSLSRTMRKKPFEVTVNQAFSAVIEACAQPRASQHETWITPQMQSSYIRLHELGHAMSVECWQEERLAGGLYGIQSGRVFFGESMFTRVTDASKVALVSLSRMGFSLIDCQVPNPHLESLGAVALERSRFLQLISKLSGDRRPSAALSSFDYES